jgi:hypothetical protein
LLKPDRARSKAGDRLREVVSNDVAGRRPSAYAKQFGHFGRASEPEFHVRTLVQRTEGSSFYDIIYVIKNDGSAT